MPSIQSCPCCGAETKTCPICGRSFGISTKQHYLIYCSRECWHVFTRNKRSARFWSHVPDRPADGCWPWVGATRGDYGVFSKGHKNPIGAHRMSYELEYGAIPDGLLVRHLCHNRFCVRPDHLLLGTTQDNVRDRVEAGRSSRHGGTKKLTDADVEAVRIMLDQGMTGKDIASHFGVSEGLISMIKHKQHRF